MLHSIDSWNRIPIFARYSCKISAFVLDLTCIGESMGFARPGREAAIEGIFAK